MRFFLVFFLFSSSVLSKEVHFGTDLLINLGGSAYTTKMNTGEKRKVNFGHFGHDIRLKYFHTLKFIPFLLFSGHKLFTTKQDLKSFRFKIGVGSQYYFNEKYGLSLNLLRAKTELLTTSEEGQRNQNGVIYEINLLGMVNFAKIKDHSLKALIGVGLFLPQQKTHFNLKTGDSQSLGLRLETPDIEAYNKFLINLMAERNVIRSSTFRQVRNSISLSAGKEF